MKTIKIGNLAIPDQEDYLAIIKQTISELGYSVSFYPLSDDLFGQNENDIDIIVLEPRIVRWEWLDVLIQSRRFYTNIPVILFLRSYASPQSMFLTLSGDSSVFLFNGEDMLIENFHKVIHALEMSRKQILFVDDDVHILRAYERSFRKTAWKVLTIPSAKKALEIIQSENIHMVITDIKMPGMHGFELIKEIRKYKQDLPVIVCSGYQGMRDDADILLNKVAGFFEKPVDLEILKSKIKDVFKNSGRINNQFGA